MAGGMDLMYGTDMRIKAYLAKAKKLSNPNNQIYFDFLVSISLSPPTKILSTVMNPLNPKYRKVDLLVLIY